MSQLLINGYRRRDFRCDILTDMSEHQQSGALFVAHEIFTPVQIYPPITARELAALAEDQP